MIQFEHVDKYYSGVRALNDISFSLRKGQLAFMTGHSGAGKTTLLKVLLGLERVSSGKIIVGAKDITKFSSRKLACYRRRVGIIFQDPMLLNQSLYDNVALPLKILGYSKKVISRRVEAALDVVDLLSKIDQNTMLLSTGERQRVAIARAVVTEPRILLADEPTGNLDPLLSKIVMEMFEKFCRMGMTVLIVTHNVNLIQEMPYNILHLRRGKLIEKEREHVVS